MQTTAFAGQNHAIAALNRSMYGIPAVMSAAAPGDGVRDNGTDFELVSAKTVQGLAPVYGDYVPGMVMCDRQLFADPHSAVDVA